MARIDRPVGEFLTALRKTYQECRYIPSYNALLDVFHVASKRTVSQKMQLLAHLGYLERVGEEGKQPRWSPTDKFFEHPIGTQAVRAGLPEPIQDATCDLINIDRYLIKDPDKTFLLSISGRSMVDAGILPGDILVMERAERAEPGDIVVALVDGECTVKYLRADNNGFYLQAANERQKGQYPDLYPKHSLEIHGVMTGLVRALGKGPNHPPSSTRTKAWR